MKYKVGDYVRLLKPFHYAGAVKGKVYKIINVKDNYLLYIPEGIKHAYYDGTNPGWWYHENCLEPALRIGEQMEFEFMYDK